jgi:FMN-binding domain
VIHRVQHVARAASVAALAVVAVGALASCSSESAAGQSGSSASSTATGTWTETGDYQTPGGQESVTVTLTAKKGTVTAVKVVGSGNDVNSQQYEGMFISGISAEVVGKPLATLQVGAVSGSSLTGQGFNAAVAKIRSDAA